jgi:hypothetical protein
MQEVLVAYVSGVVVLLAMATRIDSREELGLKPILIAAFGWPLVAPVVAWRVWIDR